MSLFVVVAARKKKGVLGKRTVFFSRRVDSAGDKNYERFCESTDIVVGLRCKIFLT